MSSRNLNIAVVTCCLFLAACAVSPNNEDKGRVVGGIVGGVLGSQIGSGTGQTVAAVAGTLLGVLIGGHIGHHMDEHDRANIAYSLEHTGTGTARPWRNPDTGSSYTVTPTKTYQHQGAPCREFIVNGSVDGRVEQLHGTACRENDGRWRILK